MLSHELSFRYTEAEAIRILQENSDTDEPDNEEEYVPEDDFQAYESDSSSDEDLSDSDEADSFSCTDNDSDSECPSSRQYTARNCETLSPLLRTSPSNVLRVTSGVNPSVRYKASSSPCECWRLFVDNSILISIKTHTIRETTIYNSNFLFSMEKLEAFIALQYARSIYGKSHSVDFLWSEKYGPPLYKETMSRSDFVEVKKFIRFDNKDCRSQRLVTDKFIHSGGQYRVTIVASYCNELLF